MQADRRERRHLEEWIQTGNRWRSLAVFALMVMELSWVALWCNLLISPDDRISYLRTFIVLGFIMLGVYIAASLMNYMDVSLFASRVIIVLLLSISLIVGVGSLEKTYNLAELSELPARIAASFFEGNVNPEVFMIIFITLFLCWRAVVLAGRPLGPEMAIGRFRTGIFMFLGYGLLRPMGQIGPHGGFYVFLFSGLLMMSLTRIASVGQFRGGQQIPYNWRWLAGIVISILVILSAAILVSRITDEGRLRYIITVFSWIGFALALLISPLLWLVIRGVDWVFEFINLGAILEFLKDAYQSLEDIFESALAVLRSLLSGFSDRSIIELFRFLANSSRLIIFGGILLMILIVALAVRRFRINLINLNDDSYQSLLDEQDLFQLIKDALRRGLGRILEGFEQAFRLQEMRRLLAAARIRRIYTRLMRLSARLGSPRLPSRTPIEFLASLCLLFPNLKSELEVITFMYVKVRYGELPEPSDEMAAVERAWQRIQMEGRGMIRGEKKKAD